MLPSLVLPLVTMLSSIAAELYEYCPTEVFRASCGRDEIIFLQSARYGRMKIGRCVIIDYGNIGCNTDVMRYTDRRCSGRHKCEIRIPDAVFETTKPCPSDFKSYFETSYDCVKVATPYRQSCSGPDHVTLTGRTGYIANIITEGTGYGNLTCPWRILLPRGQRINVTLLDFATPINDNDFAMVQSPSLSQRQDSNHVCYQYAIVTEKTSTTRNTRVCGGNERVRHILTSRTNSVEVRIITRNNVESEKVNHFALKWEAIGCPDVAAPHMGWKRYSGDGHTIFMGCNTSGKQWTLTCEENIWVGKIEDCTVVVPEVAGMKWGSISLPYGVSVGIIAGLALIVGVIILLVGLIFMEWRKMRIHNRAHRHSIIVSSAVNHHDDGAGLKEEQYVKNYTSATANNTLKQNNIIKEEEEQQQQQQQQQMQQIHHHQQPGDGVEDNGVITVVDGKTNDYTYMREVWPMAPPPGLVSGTSTYPRKANKNNYGSTTQGTMGRPRSTGNNVEIEHEAPPPKQQRHIYDSPKTMRKLDNGPRYFELNRGKQYREDDEDLDDEEEDHRHS